MRLSKKDLKAADAALTKGVAIMEQKPSIGRIVHYQAYGTPKGEYPSVPRAAVVTKVHSEAFNVVSLCVLNPTGIFFNEDVEYDADGAPGSWRWPPRT